MDFLYQKPERFSIKTDYHTFLIIDKCKTTNFLKKIENQVLTDAAKINVNRIQNYPQNELKKWFLVYFKQAIQKMQNQVICVWKRKNK